MSLYSEGSTFKLKIKLDVWGIRGSNIKSLKESKQTIHYIYLIFSSYYVQTTLLIWSKKLESCLTVVSILVKIRFGYTQIIVSKIGIPMLKTVCINPWVYLSFFGVLVFVAYRLHKFAPILLKFKHPAF